MSYITAEELLAGGSLTHDVGIPAAVLAPAGGIPVKGPMRVKLRPLTIRDVQRITKAAKDNDTLLSALMLKEAVAEPPLTFEQVNSLPTGLARFLLEEVTRISGLKMEKDTLADVVQAPLARACFILAREFGWSPQEVGELTMGQILLYLEMIRQKREKAESA